MKAGLFIICILVAGAHSLIQPQKVVTFNTALTALFDTSKVNIKARTDKIIEELIKLDADVYCLQEVWFELVARYIVDQLKLTHPYSFSEHHLDSLNMRPYNSSQPTPCDVKDGSFMVFFRCMISCSQSATTNGTGDLIQCSTNNCGLMDLSDECITCLSTHANALDCAFYSTTAVNRPGLLLLSKSDITNPSLHYFHEGRKLLVSNAYIEADIAGLGKTVCAHLAANLGPTYLESRLADTFTSYEEQNLYQVNHLIALTNPYSQVTLMGCLNTGPMISATAVSAEFPQSYEALMNATFSNVFVDEVGTCTYCSDNGYVTSKNSFVVDYVLTKGLNSSTPKIVLNQPLVVNTKPNVIYNPMSDHYGVMVTIA